MKGLKFIIFLAIYVVVCVTAFNMLIVQQENVLRQYFIVNPRQKIAEYNNALSNSLYKYFVRENKDATLQEAIEYVRKYGRTSLFETIFIYRSEKGRFLQVSKTGIKQISEEALRLNIEKVYPVTIDRGRLEGYLMIIVKDTGGGESEKGLRKYKTLSYSLRALFLLLILALALVAMYHTYSSKMRLGRDMAELKASTDGLTGLYTHEYFMKALDVEIEKFRIYKMPLGMVMLDVDYFKRYNDEYGHVAGDKVLQEVAGVIKSTTRSTDICARYGGEEFAIIIPTAFTPEEVSKEKPLGDFVSEVKNATERIRKSIEEHPIVVNNNKTVNVTVSIGVSLCHERVEHARAGALLEKADTALYKAKTTGRNKVHVDEGSVS